MHYGHFKQQDPRVLKTLIECFPFATISVNSPDGPITAHAPLTFRQGVTANGMVEFHLAKENPIMPYLQNGAKVTIVVSGPSAAISPSWYTARFAGDKPDRSKTAPTYDYVNATFRGTLQAMDTEHLTAQISDLVAAHEAADGWKVQEIDPATFTKWRDLIAGFRIPIESFDLTAKLSQEQNPADKAGIIAGLRKRGASSDIAMATLIDVFDGSPESLITGLGSLNTKCNSVRNL
ncbi:MAG: FMN-binding negative transcriptional regulator [Alphaproteobacteria bacterium]